MRRADLLLDAERLHERRLLAVTDDALDHVRGCLLEIADDPLVRALVVDVRLLEVAGEEIADDAKRQLGLLVDELRRVRRLRLRLDRLPEPLEEDEVALDVLLGRAFGGGADDDAALLDVETLEDVLQPVALVVVEPAGDAETLALRDEHDEAAGQRDLRRQARALRLHRILDRLDEDRLAALDQVLDLAAVALFDLRADDLVDVEEAVLLEADLDERGLHARQDVVDLAEVDVARDRAVIRPLEITSAAWPSSSTATRFSPTSTETSSSRFAAGSGARRCGSRRRRCWELVAAAFLPLGKLALGLLARLLFAPGPRPSRLLRGAGGAPGFLRPRPPRLPRRRFGLVGSLDSGAAASSAAAGVSSGSGPDSSSRASSARWSAEDFLRKRNQGKEKTPSRWRAAATPKSCRARARCCQWKA